MVKKGRGLKRKIAIEKITKKDSLAVACTKRCGGLFSKASQLCLLSGAQIAILATPPSSNSNVSFNSFGHSSVDAIVSAFLAGKRPLVPSENNKHMREDIGVCLTQKSLGLGFWWEDVTFTKSQNPQELSDAVDSMRKLLKHVKKLRSLDHHDVDIQKKSDHLVSHHGTQEPDQTLNIPDDCLNKTKDTETVVLDDDDDDDLPGDINENTEEHDQIHAICDSFCDSDNNAALPTNNLEGYNNQLDVDIDQFMGFDSSFFDDWVCDTAYQELQEDGAFVLPTSLDEDTFFNEITSAL